MGRTRQLPEAQAPQRQAQQPPLTDAQRAAVIAAILGGAVAAASPAAAISFILGGVVAPFALPPAVASGISDGAARLAVEGVPEPPSVGLDSPLGRMHIQNLIRRAQYAIQAAKRMARRVGAGASLRSAFLQEAGPFKKHRSAEADRTDSGRMAHEALRRYGRRATWIHGDPKEPRPTHLAADGKQFDILDPPVSVGKVLPGVLPGCTCTIGAPRPGARRIT